MRTKATTNSNLARTLQSCSITVSAFAIVIPVFARLQQPAGIKCPCSYIFHGRIIFIKYKISVTYEKRSFHVILFFGTNRVKKDISQKKNITPNGIFSKIFYVISIIRVKQELLM